MGPQQTALVTGAAKRLGRSIALGLAESGTNVILHYYSSQEDAEAVAEQARAGGANAWTVQADLADPDEAAALFSKASELAGEIQILVNNASIFPEDRLLEFTKPDLELNMQVNAFAPLLLSRAFAAKQDKGVIVNLLDSRIKSYDKAHAAYHLSKQMLFSLTRTLAVELAPGIRVNGVAPGLILPPNGEDVSYLEKMKHTNPLGRYGSPDHVTETVKFLINSEFITGQVIYVDGGRHLR
jgi:pteridine reductase